MPQGSGTAAAVPAAQAPIAKTTIATGLTYDTLVGRFERELGRLDAAAIAGMVERHAPWRDVETAVEAMGGRHGLMIFYRADQGAVTSLSGREKRCRLYLIGNPVIANQIVDIDLRGGFYVPFRVCLYDDRGPGGAAICYDRPSSFLAALGRSELDGFGVLLDGKIDGVVAAICAG